MASKKKAGQSADDRGGSPTPPPVSHLSVESIKMMAESSGVAALPDVTAKFLSDDVTNKLKRIITEAVKFTGHAKRKKLFTEDIDYALRTLNVEPVYGFSTSTAEGGLPFRFASGGGRELVFLESEKEVDLLKLATAPSLPKVSVDVMLQN